MYLFNFKSGSYIVCFLYIQFTLLSKLSLIVRVHVLVVGIGN